jgi:6,7-dimethyl-8-ribityllumazine synthase
MKSNSMCFDIATRDRVAFIQSCWHREIVDRLRDSFLDAFATLDGRQVDIFEVPGAFEIPLRAQCLADTGKYAAIVAAGLVVDGGIYRHEFVAGAVIDGLMRTQLATHTPIFSAVLTPHDFLAEGQPDFFAAHFSSKGIEAAQACASMIADYSREQVSLAG